MDGPAIARTSGGVSIPELHLQDLTLDFSAAGVSDHSRILAAEGCRSRALGRHAGNGALGQSQSKHCRGHRKPEQGNHFLFFFFLSFFDVFTKPVADDRVILKRMTKGEFLSEKDQLTYTVPLLLCRNKPFASLAPSQIARTDVVLYMRGALGLPISTR